MADGHHEGCLHAPAHRGRVPVRHAEVWDQGHDDKVFTADDAGAGGCPSQAGRPTLAIRASAQLVLSGHIHLQVGERDGGLVALPVRLQREFHTGGFAGRDALAHAQETGRDGGVFDAGRSQRHRPARSRSRHEPPHPATQRRRGRQAPGARAAQRGREVHARHIHGAGELLEGERVLVGGRRSRSLGTRGRVPANLAHARAGSRG